MAYNMEWNYEETMAANPEFKQSDIDELRTWIQAKDSSCNIPKDISDSLLLCFHKACNLIVADTKKCIKAYYNIREKAPEHFDDRDINIESVKEAANAVYFSVLPGKTDDGYMIVQHCLSDFLPERYMFNASVKMLFMTIDRCIIENGPVKGIVFLFDMRGVKLGHITRVNITSLAKFFTYIQEAMPVAIKRIDIMNTVSFFDKILALMKPFMKKELVSLLNLNPVDLDYEKYYKECLPKKCLPAEYGGDLPDIPTLNKKNMEKLISLKMYFEEEEKHRYTYSKKQKKKSKLDKGFQDLSID